ncbi:MAG: hypothetical protein ACK5ZS_00110 [bacterium]|jgi:hypothetical protein
MPQFTSGLYAELLFESSFQRQSPQTTATSAAAEAGSFGTNEHGVIAVSPVTQTIENTDLADSPAFTIDHSTAEIATVQSHHSRLTRNMR